MAIELTIPFPNPKLTPLPTTLIPKGLLVRAAPRAAAAAALTNHPTLADPSWFGPEIIATEIRLEAKLTTNHPPPT